MARNTLLRPVEVKLAPLAVSLRGGTVKMAMPKHAVVSIEVRVGAGSNLLRSTADERPNDWR